ncbi:hypothetical protein FD755_015847, partial [Muntiacus reevesi]
KANPIGLEDGTQTTELGKFSSVQFSRSVVSDSLRPHESQHARPPCPSPAPERLLISWLQSPSAVILEPQKIKSDTVSTNPMNSMRRQNDRILKEELPRSVGAQYATGDQWRNNSRKNEGMEPKQKQYVVVDVTGDRSKVRCCKEQYCIGTWNVGSTNQGKLEVVKQEMARVNVHILGISELKWTGMGEFNSDDHYIFYCGQESLRRNGVAIIVNKRVRNAVLGCNLKNDRMISVRFQGKSFNITVIQAYAPTSNPEEAEVEWFYEDLQDLLELIPKKDVLFVIRDWNAKVGSQETPGVTGKFGLGVRNEAGQRLIEFCQENALVIANTLFQQHKRRLYTWRSPDGQHRNQIDYILCNQRWRSSIQSAKTRPGADCGSDHELLITKFRLKLKRVGITTRSFRSKKQRRKGKIFPFEYFLSDQCKEIGENNRMGKTRDFFKKIRDTKGTFHAKMGSIWDRNEEPEIKSPISAGSL